MVRLLRGDIIEYETKSSKGNQLKWCNNGIWYKADYTGYEGLSEYVVSELLKRSTLKSDEFVEYKTEEIQYEYVTYKGCKSHNFLPKGWVLITLERLFKTVHQQSLNKAIYSIEGYITSVPYLITVLRFLLIQRWIILWEYRLTGLLIRRSQKPLVTILIFS
jgi:hypothetical protein